MNTNNKKRIKFDRRTEGTPIDMSDFWAKQKDREKAELQKKIKEQELEQKRIDDIQCPVCKSTTKYHHIKSKNNGIMGQGYNSWIVEDYLICKGCGIHYSDITKMIK